jgi:uncharacterized protein YgiM (DUF1202 family)
MTKFTIALIPLLISVLACTSSPLSSSVDFPETPARMVVCVDTANVRQSAGTSAPVTGELHRGTEVTPLETVTVADGGTWVRVGNVWVNKRLLCEIK